MIRNPIALALLSLTLMMNASAAEPEFVPLQRTDKCPVCGMFVYKYPQWVAEILYQDGSYAVFDGSKDMFKYYFAIERYEPAKHREDIAAIYVTEYYSNRIMRAEQLYFVLGSDVLGPMGHEFVPVKGKEAADAFMLDHSGNRILRFDEIGPTDIPD